MFFSDSCFPRKAGKVLPSRLKADESPSGVQMSRNILVNFSSFSSPWLKIRLSPFRAPGPRHAHWLSVFGPSTFASRRSQRICQAKKSPTLGMVKSSWKVFNYTWKLFSSSPVRYSYNLQNSILFSPLGLSWWTWLLRASQSSWRGSWCAAWHMTRWPKVESCPCSDEQQWRFLLCCPTFSAMTQRDDFKIRNYVLSSDINFQNPKLSSLSFLFSQVQQLCTFVYLMKSDKLSMSGIPA